MDTPQEDEISASVKEKMKEETLEQEDESNSEQLEDSPEEEKEEEEVEYVEYNTLKDFGYRFNENGELRDIETDGGFEFNVHNSRSANQKRYERLGEVMTEHIYKLLQDEGGLLKTFIPIDAAPEEPTSFIFRSDDALTCDKLMLIIHGSGAVRAGQWARRLIINHSLESGTQLPYIKKAKELGFGVLVLNTNYNYDKVTREPFRGSSSPEEHFQYVWKHFVLNSNAKHVAMVAHSYGGVVTTRAAAVIPEVIERTFAVAFTDSVHFGVKAKNQLMYTKWMRSNVCNWASSSKRLDAPLQTDVGDCRNVSAGTNVHEETSWKAFNSVWKFIGKKLEELSNNSDVAPTLVTRRSATTTTSRTSHKKPDTSPKKNEKEPDKKKPKTKDDNCKEVSSEGCGGEANEQTSMIKVVEKVDNVALVNDDNESTDVNSQNVKEKLV